MNIYNPIIKKYLPVYAAHYFEKMKCYCPCEGMQNLFSWGNVEILCNFIFGMFHYDAVYRDIYHSHAVLCGFSSAGSRVPFLPKPHRPGYHLCHSPGLPAGFPQKYPLSGGQLLYNPLPDTHDSLPKNPLHGCRS